MSKRVSWRKRFFNNFKNRFLDPDEPIGVHAQNYRRPSRNHLISKQKQATPKTYTVLNKKDLPQNFSGKVNLTIGIIRKLILSFFISFILLMGLSAGLATGYFCAIIKQEPIPSNVSLKNQI
ncbi:hypothetical protein EQ500_15355, partial [Lactobacillus sp. XV13L]|nr:hypothetical protein [Lactobacillus sp. XV13L]